MKSFNYEKWDVHHHISPKFYADELERMGMTKVWGLKQTTWSEEMQLKMMTKHNITRAIMSISTPGVYFGGHIYSRGLARRCNEYMASLIKKHPDKLGAFGAVPLPDVEGAIAELKYTLDVLNFNGIGLLSNVSGNYLGNKEYRSFFEEANKRNATIYIHPTACPTKMDNYLLNYMYYFKLDTTRTIIDFVRSGYHRDFPNIKFILSHGGGVLPAIYPALIERLKEENQNIEIEFEKWKTQIYLDTSLVAYHEMLPSIISFAGIRHTLFGSDYCWAKASYAHFIKLLSTFDIEDEYLQDIFKNNAKRALKAKEPIKHVSIDRIKPIVYRNRNSKIKYHYHCNPKKVVEHCKRREPSFCDDKPEIWDTREAVSWMSRTNYEKIMLSLDIPQLWNLKDSDIIAILRTYNEAVTEIRNEDPKRIGAFGAIDVENAEQALKEIDYCLNDLKLDGICIYTKIYAQELENIFDQKILDKLRRIEVPILVHPKDSTGIPIFNENYLDSVYFLAKMLYLNKFEYLKDSEYILTHTGGLVRFLAKPLGILYYIQLHKRKMGQFVFDWLITKDEKGYEYLKSVSIDD